MHNDSNVGNCTFNWDSFLSVTYNEQCDFEYLEPSAYVSIGRLCASIILSFLGASFNLWAVVLLTLDYRGVPRGDARKCSSAINNSNINSTKHSSHNSAKRTTMQAGLIVFCLFEVLYHLTSTVAESIRVIAHVSINNNVISPPINDQLTYELSVLPYMSTIFDWLRDSGICGRNWAITLITIARAEVVVWPLASHMYQRCLRAKRVFLIVFSMFALFSLILAGLRRFAEKITVCYSKKLASYCVTSEPFLFDINRYSVFYFSFQTLLPWLLILIFTSLIIIKLKPCTRQSENLIHRHNPLKKAGGRDNHLRASIAVTTLAVFCTIFEFPTFALSMYYVSAEDPADLSALDTTANICLQVDSIANFFLLIITMPSLRNRIMGRLGKRKQPTPFAIECKTMSNSEVLSDV